MKIEHQPSTAPDYFSTQKSFIPSVKLGPTTALLVVDMQIHDAHPNGSFNLAMEKLHPGSMAYFNERTERLTVPRIQQLLAEFRERRLPVIHLALGSEYEDYRDFSPRHRQWIQEIESRSGISGIFWNQSPDYAFRDELAPASDEPVVVKKTFGAFNSSDLETVARDAGIDTFVIVGISTNCCVESTVRDAAERGFACVVVDDATADYDHQAHLASLNALRFNHARIAPFASDVIEALKTGEPL